jgi:crotonobetainyl-CoA:carnitine CoA-transferase CaiB-like acyl-CoA transferase
MTAQPTGALDGVRVLDASQMLAGPICGMRLGDLGGDVIKFEPLTGEYNRHSTIGGAKVGEFSTTFLGLNRNKRSVAVDLKNPNGREAFEDLVAKSDVFLQNYRLTTAEKLGITWEDLRKINPRLIYCQITGYGETGPMKDRPGQDLLVQGYSGSMWAVGSADDPPMPSALWAADSMTGYQAAIGILAALNARHQTGRGQKVSVAMIEVVMDCQAQELTTYLNTGLMPERPDTSTAHALVAAPYGVFRTADGWMTLAMAPLPKLGAALGIEAFSSMTKGDDGFTHRERIMAILKDFLVTQSTEHWLSLLDEHRLWGGRINSYADLAAEPHIVENGIIAEINHPKVGPIKMPRPPMRLSDTPASIRLAPPALGQDTVSVLTDLLGYDAAKLSALRSAGAIYCEGD